MREVEVPVTFQPQGKTVHVLEGTRLVEAAARAGIALDLPCGGEGVCGKCRVVVREGAGRPGPVERDVLTEEELRQGFRLACQSEVLGPTTVEVPPTSLLASYHKILAHGNQTSPIDVDPVVHKQYVELPPPSRGSDEADLVRIERAVGPLEVDLALLRELPVRLRDLRFRGTAVLAGGTLIDFEPGDTESAGYAAAFDVGTTTLVGSLLDLKTGEELAVNSRLNPQTRFGDDVLTRIQFARDDPQGLPELRQAITQAVDEMIGELTDEAGTGREQIYEATFSGNTTMLELLCGIDPRYLGEVPFVPAAGNRLLVPASELALGIHPRGRAYVLPVIGGFVGGDTVAGILATGLANSERPTLLIDVGTNVEIVLVAEGKLAAAATAAGPAFEGARISQGMRGSTGAIEKVVVDGRLRTNVIGNVPPVGICGSALIDLAAELLRHQVLTPEGRIRPPDELPAELLPDLRRRVLADDGRLAFLVAPENETETGKPILLTQRDVRQLQLASGAIRAGIVILLKRAGLRPADLDAVLIAGGFGNFIRRSNAQQIGLLPGGIEHRRIRYQGNTSLAGARLVAVSREARQLAEQWARRTEHVDLSTDPAFRDAFAEAMIFPSDAE